LQKLDLQANQLTGKYFHYFAQCYRRRNICVEQAGFDFSLFVLILYGASGVEEIKVELKRQLQKCDINVNDNAEEKSAKKAQQAKMAQI
jgi:hypothetical protein